MVQLSHPHLSTGNTVALTIWTFVGKVKLCFLICCLALSNFSFKEKAPFNFMAVVTVYSDFEAQENKICHSFPLFHLYLPWSDGTRCHDLIFLKAFSLYSFTFIKKLFSSSSSLSAISVVSSASLKLNCRPGNSWRMLTQPMAFITKKSQHSSRLEARFLILWDLNKNWLAFPTSHFVEIQWCPQGFFKFQGVRVLVPSSSDFLLPRFSSLLIQAT